MRITNIKLTAFRGVSASLELPFGTKGKNLLVYGENGSAKSSFARALEYLFCPESRPEHDILANKNLFDSTQPKIEVTFVGKFAGRDETRDLTWDQASGKPSEQWIRESAYRSAFLDHRKLLTLSERTRSLPKRFFETAVEYLFSDLQAGSSGKTVAELYHKIQSDAQAYREAQMSRSSSSSSSSSSEADSGVTDAVAHYRPIEEAVNELNTALDDYLLETSGKPRLVTEAERILQRFEGHGLTISLAFNHLTFNRGDGTFGGGEIMPEVTYCSEPLGVQMGSTWASTHHEILNEARLTALALSLFFAAVRLQDSISYIAGSGDPQDPARLLVLDDILVGLDYAHRIPVLDILREEFAANNRYQVLLLTHDRVWFDVARLQLEGKEWDSLEIYTKHGKGPKNSDFPVRKQSSAQLLGRALSLLDDDHEIPAAANYTRSALETALKKICEKRNVPIPFHPNPGKISAETFINALRGEKLHKGGKWYLIPRTMYSQLRALRTTVLNPLSHFNPTTITEPEVRKAIALAERLTGLAAKIKAEPRE